MNPTPLSPPDQAPFAKNTDSPRRHDLDALRAAAMLLGITYHCALSFSLGSGWIVEDVEQSKALFVFQAFIHGFRMQLFMLLSGFFTALLWRKRGLVPLMHNRIRKVLLPCLAGLVTVVPAIHGAARLAPRHHRDSPSSQSGDSGAAAPKPAHHTVPRVETPSNIPGPATEHPISSTLSANDLFNGGTEKGAPRSESPRMQDSGEPARSASEERQTVAFDVPFTFNAILERLLYFPVFVLVWFLWFLFWLLPGFVVYAKAANHWRWRFSPHPLLSSQASLVWLVPLTILPTAWMGAGHGHFGPDTSMGILPLPHVLAYYALFFGFGVLYFESNDAAGRLGRAWRWTLPVSVLAVFPLGLEFAAGPFGVRETLLPAPWHRPVAVALQALYAWMMCFAGIGLFRSLMVRESKNIRYLSDASFWFYLAHLPVVLLVQAGISTWIFPAILKFFATCLIVSFAMLWSYEKTVRNTVVGRFLRGACTCFDRQKTASNRTSLYS